MVGREAGLIIIPFDIAVPFMWLLREAAGLTVPDVSGIRATAATTALPTRKPVSVTRMRRMPAHLLLFVLGRKSLGARSANRYPG
jgi:hypothetical protein